MSDLPIVIRPETPADYFAAEHMTQRAFWNIHGPGCNEHLLVRLLRSHPDYLPQFSRVAELDGRIVGGIWYTRARVVNNDASHDIVTFGPLAVEPTLHGAGIGRRLLEATLPLVRAAGYPGVCILGEPRYYPKQGFRRCSGYGITSADGQDFDALMAYPLDDAAFASIHGRLVESDVFAACENSALLHTINAEFPAYPLVKLQEGFMQLYDQHIGRVEDVDNEGCTLSFWEQTLPAVAACEPVPRPGDLVLFRFCRHAPCQITAVKQNLL